MSDRTETAERGIPDDPAARECHMRSKDKVPDQMSKDAAMRMRNLRPFARSRLSIVVLTPVSILLGAAIGAAQGASEGWSEAQKAWRTVNGK
jgi:hypothetical protein